MLGEFHSGRSYHVSGCEFNVNKSTICIKVSLDRNTHRTRLMLRSVDENVF